MTKAFLYNGEWYLRCIPVKSLFKSTMVHEVVNRGDIFAVCLASQKLTIVPGIYEAEQADISFQIQRDLPF